MSVPAQTVRRQAVHLQYICTSCIRKRTNLLQDVRPAISNGLIILSSPRRVNSHSPAVQRTPSKYPTRKLPNNHIGHVPITCRAYSTAPTGTQISSAATPLPHRRLLLLTGQHAAKFLQGLITNNVDPLSSTSPFYAAFLDARGRVLYDVFIWTSPEINAEKGNGEWACYIEVDEKDADSLKKHLKKHKLRSRIQIEDMSMTKLQVWAAWGETMGGMVAERVFAAMEDPRGVGLSRYLVNLEKEHPGEYLSVANPEDYRIQRYLQGIPEGPEEILREASLPMEFNIDLSRGIAFTKGCYVGQELTIRTKHTGVVRKRVLPVQYFGSESSTKAFEFDSTFALFPRPGANIKQLDSSGAIQTGRASGKIVASVGNVGLALCRLEMMTPLRVSAEVGSYKEGMEFGVEGEVGRVVRVKPVLHPWFVQRKDALWGTPKVQG